MPFSTPIMQCRHDMTSGHGMELKWLEDLVALAEAGSLTEAAARRNVTQPAFTRRIKAIEAALGAEVLDRARKPARILPAIARQLDAMRTLAIDVRRLKQDITAPDGERRQLVIAGQHALTVAYLPAFIARIRDSFPNLTFRLRSANRDECYSLLMTRQADVLLAYETARLPIAPDETLIEKIRIGGDQLIPIAAPGLLTAESRRTPHKTRLPETLKIIAYPRDVFFGALQHQELLPLLSERHRVVTVCETALAPAVLQLALAGAGIAWVPSRLAADPITRGDLIDLGDDLGRIPLDIMVARLRTPRSRLAESLWTQFGLTSDGPLPSS